MWLMGESPTGHLSVPFLTNRQAALLRRRHRCLFWREQGREQIFPVGDKRARVKGTPSILQRSLPSKIPTNVSAHIGSSSIMMILELFLCSKRKSNKNKQTNKDSSWYAFRCLKQLQQSRSCEQQKLTGVTAISFGILKKLEIFDLIPPSPSPMWLKWSWPWLSWSYMPPF